ncbi:MULTISPECIES: hypothetical protein [Thiomicrorhabdus]|uniref:Lipoprotein n=1 Tax=Thiomicrorhabdus heinhorstiae TaxID=2748010 RepID=A0ABS0BYW5_9GAMM|nr:MULTISPECIES: hypothetical protein [Thiomicrorhabdus]MBF6058990.1 hypothetical protein [Thiomicrorhabdus heinhorstiae]
MKKCLSLLMLPLFLVACEGQKQQLSYAKSFEKHAMFVLEKRGEVSSRCYIDFPYKLPLPPNAVLPQICSEFYRNVEYIRELQQEDRSSFLEDMNRILDLNEEAFKDRITPLFYLYNNDQLTIDYITSGYVDHRKLYDDHGFNFLAYYVSVCREKIVLELMKYPEIYANNPFWKKEKTSPLEIYEDRCKWDY